MPVNGDSILTNKMITRGTSLGVALATAALKFAKSEDSGRPTKARNEGQPLMEEKQDQSAPWMARRVLMNLDREGYGTTKEPAWNARLSYRTAQELKQRDVLPA